MQPETNQQLDTSLGTSTDVQPPAPATELSNTPPQPMQQQPKQAEPKKENGVLSFIGTLVAAFLLVQFINLFLFQSYKVFGSSMYPTLHDGDRLIISKVKKSAATLFRNTYEPKRGEIVVFDDPHESGMQLIKRVIGLPGERVVLRDGVITVYNKEKPNGFNPDDAEYGATLPAGRGNIDVTVPEGHIFVSGDNREGNNSLDSRNELGTVPEDLLVGTLSVRIFPFDQIDLF